MPNKRKREREKLSICCVYRWLLSFEHCSNVNHSSLAARAVALLTELSICRRRCRSRRIFDVKWQSGAIECTLVVPSLKLLFSSSSFLVSLLCTHQDEMCVCVFGFSCLSVSGHWALMTPAATAKADAKKTRENRRHFLVMVPKSHSPLPLLLLSISASRLLQTHTESNREKGKEKEDWGKVRLLFLLLLLSGCRISRRFSAGEYYSFACFGILPLCVLVCLCVCVWTQAHSVHFLFSINRASRLEGEAAGAKCDADANRLWSLRSLGFLSFLSFFFLLVCLRGKRKVLTRKRKKKGKWMNEETQCTQLISRLACTAPSFMYRGHSCILTTEKEEEIYVHRQQAKIEKNGTVRWYDCVQWHLRNTLWCFLCFRRRRQQQQTDRHSR